MSRFLREEPDSVLLSVKVQPRASKNEIGGLIGDELKIKIMAPPVDTAANEALIEFLAETFDCPRNRIELVRGHKSRHKTIKLQGLQAAAVLAAVSPNRKS